MGNRKNFVKLYTENKYFSFYSADFTVILKGGNARADSFTSLEYVGIITLNRIN